MKDWVYCWQCLENIPKKVTGKEMCVKGVCEKPTQILYFKVCLSTSTHASELSSAVKKLSISPIMDILSFVLK